MNYQSKSKKITYIATFFVLIIANVLFSCQTDEKIKFDQYYIAGKQIYVTNCANCHQKDGLGLKNLYPPLQNSSYLKDSSAVICLIKNGLSGEIIVDGKTYNQPMPANNHLQNLDIAELMTYINKEFRDTEKTIETDFVAKTLNNCKKN